MKKWTSLLASAFLLFFLSCNEMDKYYDNDRHATSVSVGNAWDYLESRGNFTNFLAAVQKVGYEDLVRGKGLATIFAPDDEAFQKYFARHGYSSVNDVPDAELSNMVTYHLLYYSFNADRFMEYRPEGTTADDDYVGLYFKYRTRSRDANEMIEDPSKGKEVEVLHQEKYIPVFTPNLYGWYNNHGSSGSTGAVNYNYFYDSYGSDLWQGDNWVAGNEPYFRVSNAGVKEYSIITDNGYLYVLDDVVEPLKTIYQTIAADDNFSTFAHAYDRFKDLTYNEYLSLNYNNRDSAFLYQSTGLPSIAYERTSLTISSGESTSDMEATLLGPLSSNTLTVFAPSNQAMESFYTTYWEPYYGVNNWDSIKFTPLLALMGEQVGTHRLWASAGPLLPSEISKGNAVTAVSYTPITIDPASDVVTKAFCSNGTLYGVNSLISVPKYFSYVTAPAFMNPKYNMFLLLMARSGVLDLYTAETQTFYAFYPSDDMLKNTQVGDGNSETLIYENAQPNKYGYEDITYSDGEATVSLGMAASARIVRSQVCDNMIEVAGSDEKIYRTTYSTFNYLYQKGDSIFSTAKYNSHYGFQGAQDNNDMITITEMTSDLPEVRNGRVFSLDGEKSATALMPEERSFEEISPNQSQIPWEFLETTAGTRNFYQTGIAGSLNDLTGRLQVYETIKAHDGGGTTVPRYIVFALSNQAVVDAWADRIITNGRNNLFSRYMPNLFVSVERSRLIDYPFPGDGMGTRTLYTFKTKTNTEGEYTSIQLDDMGTHLQLTDSKGRKVKVVNSFPYIYADCAVYIIDSYLDFGDDNTSTVQ